MDAQKIAQRLYESFASDDLCEHPEIVDDVEDLADEYEDLKAENARLRELVRDLYGCGDSCTHCKHWNQGDGFYCDLGVGWKARRMHELGIEVD